MGETERGRPISDERTLRDQLVAAGTEAAEKWLATRANRRMSKVNRKRLAGHIVNALWQQIEQATIDIAGWIAEDDRAALAAATVRAEVAEAAYYRLDSEQAGAGSYAGRAEAAEAERDQLRARLAELGKARHLWGVRFRDDDPDEDIEIMSSETQARELATAWRGEVLDANPTAMVRPWWEPGPWRVADATPHAVLEQLAAEQGVKLVTSIDQLTAPEDERLGDEEFAEWTSAWKRKGPCCSEGTGPMPAREELQGDADHA